MLRPSMFDNEGRDEGRLAANSVALTKKAEAAKLAKQRSV